MSPGGDRGVTVSMSSQQEEGSEFDSQVVPAFSVSRIQQQHTFPGLAWWWGLRGEMCGLSPGGDHGVTVSRSVWHAKTNEFDSRGVPAILVNLLPLTGSFQAT